jgi:predicted acylesterase/phospholipase RssA
MTDEMIDAVARESASGRLLLVATTDLDKGTSVIWSLGAIARQNTPASRALFRKVLVASASIPGIFSPVLIDAAGDRRSFEEMHVDGGTTVAFFVAPEVAHVVPGTYSGLDGANLYVVMNTQSISVPKSTEGRLGPVIERTSMTALNQMARSQLQLVSAFAREQGMSFQMTEIPADYPFRSSTDFRPDSMRALFDYAAGCAERGRLWMSLPESLRRAEDAVRRLESEPRGDGPVPCPAELRGR